VRLRRALSGAAITTLAVAAGLLLTEVALRVFHLAPTGGVFTVNARQFEEVPGMFAPGQDVMVLTKRPLPHRVRINALGYRGPEITVTKPAGEFRILYVGDSGTFGDFVANEETLPAQLEARLAGQCTGVRVINAGLGGSTITEQAPIIMRSLALSPDLVILMFSENDIDDLTGGTMWDQLAANREAKSRFPLSLFYDRVRNTALWNLALTVRGVKRVRDVVRENQPPASEPTPVAPSPSPSTAPPLRTQHRDEYAARLAALHQELTARGIPMILTAYPSHLSVYRRWDLDQLDWVQGVAQREGLPYIDLLEPLRATGQGDTTLYLLPYDGHASARGYAVTSEVIASHLMHHAPLSERNCRR
jgi:lysophospholipase L1-like esterase